MSELKFADTHNLVMFLEKPTESAGFEEIVDFLNAHTIKEDQLQALVDEKKVIITETSVRRDLHLEDAEGTECLPIATIFEELTRMGGSKKVFSWEDTLYFNYQFKLIKKWGEGSAKPTDPNTHAIILNPTITSQPKKKQPRRKQKKNTEVPQPSGSTNDVPDENVPTTSNDPLLSGEDRLKLTELMDLCTNLQKRFLICGERPRLHKNSEIASLKKVWVIRGCHPNREGKVADIDADAERTGNVVEKEVLHTTTIDELTLGQTLIKISSCKPKLDDKGKAKMTKLEMPLKKKDQIIYDQEVALNLQAQLQTKLEEEERLLQAREQEELTDEEKARLFVELLEKRKKHFAALRA
ncbi:hypothetical protein Tco_0170170 [Tanacetum coccineum]